MRFPPLTCLLLLSSPIAAQGISIGSVDHHGQVANSASFEGSLSGDGRYLAFTSFATNLAPGVSPTYSDVFLHDLWTGETTLISASMTGGPSNGVSTDPVISDDGQWIAFQSTSSDLVPGDTNSTFDVFLHHIASGSTELVSIGIGGASANWFSLLPAISADGSYVAFESRASNLVPNDTNGSFDVFLFHRQTRTLQRISETAQGVEGNWGSGHADISSDGRFVTFFSHANNFTSQDHNSTADIFLVDMATGSMSLVSGTPSGSTGNGASSKPTISGDGSLVAFESDAADLIASDQNGQRDVFLWNSATSTITRASQSATGIGGNRYSSEATLSTDGSSLLFQTSATNLFPTATLDRSSIVRFDIATGGLELVSRAANGSQIDAACVAPSVSGGGDIVTFQSDPETVFPWIGPTDSQVMVKDLTSIRIDRIGAIPGTVDFHVSGGTLLDDIFFVFGAPGRTRILSGPCQGTTMLMDHPTLAARIPVSPEGFATWTTLVPAGAVGFRVQGIDLASCLTSNPLELR